MSKRERAQRLERFSLRHGAMKRLVVFTVLVAIACMRGAITVPLPSAGKPPRQGPSYAGFDKRDFPGLQSMQVWYATSPYEWVGYYLPSPCYTGAAWTGNRAALIQQGWGLAVLYVGAQASPRCPTDVASASQGTIDADDAISVATSDGFPEGTTIFLDVERADPYPPELDAYVRAWAARVLTKKFTPGVYAHRTNAQTLYESLTAIYSAANDVRQPPMWIANSTGFDLTKRPEDSGFPFASVWQYPSDASETYGGITFRIDRNIALMRSPSG
jgi:hypothetical protein